MLFFEFSYKLDITSLQQVSQAVGAPQGQLGLLDKQ